MIAVGDPAPDFTLPDTDGTPTSLSQFRGHTVVLFFYPKDGTPGCTREARTFSAHYADFIAAGAEVFGVSSDSSASHTGFTAACNLPFKLLSDRGGAVRKAYGVPKTLGFLPGRVTFVVDARGIVQGVVNAPFMPEAHVAQSLAVVKRLATPAG